MKYRLIIIAILAISIAACNSNQKNTDNLKNNLQTNQLNHEGHDHTKTEKHSHDTEAGHEGHDHATAEEHSHDVEAGCEGHDHAAAEEHSHDAEVGHEGHDHSELENNKDAEVSHEGHDHAPLEESTDEAGHEGHDHAAEEAHKNQFTAYGAAFELFAEADPFVVGQTANVLSHFSHLPSFKALEKGSITMRLFANGNEVNKTLSAPTRKGIYSFDITPAKAGKAKLIFDIRTDKGVERIVVSNAIVFADAHDVLHMDDEEVSTTNAIAFTKEQSWKIDFATVQPQKEAFGQTIKTMARVQPAQSDEVLISAKTNGTALFVTNSILVGKTVTKGEVLFSVSGNGFADNNTEVRFIEAKNNFENFKSEYERKAELAKDKIVSAKELLNAKTDYENAKVVYQNLKKNFSSSGQNAASPINGSVKHIFVQNGEYVEQGQPLASIAQNKTLLLSAEIQQKYASILGSIQTASIRPSYSKETYTLEQLNGKILSYSTTTNHENYLIPVHLQIENTINLVSGSFVEVYLKTISNTQALTIPNSALLEEQGFFFVFVQLNPELFEKREVKTGATDGLKTEILKGLSFNERVVSQGAVLVKLAQTTGSLDAHSGHVH